MSFALTERQFLDGTKTVTRRLGWKFLRVGDELLAVRKCMGLKKGEKQHVLGRIKVISVREEKLCDITDADVAREGFPGMSALGFRSFFAGKMRVAFDCPVTRIEFERMSE